MEFLKELTNYEGISGNEGQITKQLKTLLDNFCIKAEINKTGSVTAFLGEPDSRKKTILIEAHMDRIGLVVSEITDDGFLKFMALGGVDERTLPASEVYVLGKERLFGVIGALPPHLKPSGEKDSGIKIENMLIDTGYSRDELKEKVSVGDPVILKSKFTELLHGKVSTGAIDNRAGISAVLQVLKYLEGKNLEYNIKVAFSVGEELGLLGARTLDLSGTDLAIVVDVTHGQTPDAKTEGTFPLGSGAVISRGPNLDYDITNRLISFAQKQDISYSVEVSAGNTGTNAWVIQTLEQGIKCVLISIPLRYMHTSVETVDTADIKSAAQLIAKFIEGGSIFA